jgi:hypothetical protein
MELKYSDGRTYDHKLSDELLNQVISKTYRSKNQTQFLFQLVDGDFEKLKQLEKQIKNCFIGYCPGTKCDVNRILRMEPKKEWFFI